jgi:hypothetical protein
MFMLQDSTTENETATQQAGGTIHTYHEPRYDSMESDARIEIDLHAKNNVIRTFLSKRYKTRIM